MSEQADRLKERTLRFALDVIDLTRAFPLEEPGLTVRRQLTRAVTSVGANYRAACRARSHADFTSKIGIVAEEADESVYWLDLAAGAKLTMDPALPLLQQESRELTAIFSRAVGTARLKTPGDCKVGNGDREAGNGDPEVGNGDPEVGNGDPEVGN